MTDELSTHPSRLSSAIALGVAAVAVVLVTDDAAVTPLAVEAAGVLVAVGGRALHRRGWTVSGLVGLLLGTGVGLGGVGFGAAQAGGPSRIVLMLPGLFGVLFVGLALVPVRDGWQRGLLKVGGALVFITVLVSGVLRAAPYATLLVATAATIAAWDLGENAVTLGEQLGQGTETKEVELVHAGATGGMGVAAYYVGTWVPGFGVGGLSLPALVLVLVAVLLLTASLHD